MPTEEMRRSGCIERLSGNTSDAMRVSQKVFGTLVFVVRHVVYFDTSHISTPFPVTSAFETVMDFPV